MRFDYLSELSFINGSMGKKVITFWVGMSPSLQIIDKNTYILINGEEPTQWLNDTTLTSGAIYPFAWNI